MKLFCHTYILLWCLYSLQGTFYERGGSVAHILLGVIIVISMLFLFSACIQCMLPRVLKTLCVLFFVWTVYGLYSWLVGNGVSWLSDEIYLKNIWASILPVFTFYLFARKGYLTESGLRKWFVFFVVLALVQYISFREELLAVSLEDGMERTEVVNNHGYLILSLFPLLPLWNKRPLIQYLLWGVCMYVIILSMKRGAILIGVISSMWFMLKAFKADNRVIRKLWRMLLTIAIVLFAVHFIQELFQYSNLFASRLEGTLEGDSSGRDTMYQKFLKLLVYQTDVPHLLFGYGADATIRFLDNYAHNDWLEIFINNGLFVGMLYFVFVIQMFVCVRRERKNILCYMMLGLFFIIYFMKTFISMSYNDISFFSASAIGYAFAAMDNGRQT